MGWDATGGTYEIVWSNEAEEDLVGVRTFDQPRIRAAVDELRHQAETPTRNRRPMLRPLAELPEATWQARVGDLRVLYRVSRDKTVAILRVILKANRTTREAVTKGRNR